MSFINMSESAYKEFKEILTTNNIESDTVRIIISGIGWGGPSFGLVLDEQKETDNVTLINDTNFIVDKELSKEYGALTIKSSDENGYGGLSIEPEISASSGGCSSCTSCGE